MSARLYTIVLSHPSRAAAAMIARAGIPHRVVQLPAGPHPVLVHAAGFPAWTVPAIEFDDGRRLQGSLAISRVIDELVPEHPLFPRERAARRAVEDAEVWGHSELQNVPRRIIRWALLRDHALRRWFADELLHWPAPGLMATLGRPMVSMLARSAAADEPTVREDIRRLPELLDRVDGLIATGTIGGNAPNAADLQVLSAVRVLLEFEDLAHIAKDRPCEAPARRLFPRWDGPIPSSPVLQALS